jgi:DUF2934 family protein
MQDMEQAIRERAYHLWIESGRTEGHADAHWLAAQREILSASLAEIGRVTASDPAKSTKPKAKRSQRKQRAA